MNEPRIAGSATADPRAWKELMLDVASRARSAVDADTDMLYVFRQRDIEGLLNEPRVHGVGLTVFDAMGIADGPLRDWYGALMFTNDGAAHDRLRRLVSKAFTPRAVDRLRATTATCATGQLAALREAGGGDLVAALAHAPMRTMCALLGVPAEAVPDFIVWVDALSPVFGLMEPEQIARAEESIVALLAYLRELVARRSRTPADDLISALVQAEHDGDRLTRDETVAMVANLLVGGHDTTSSQIGCTLLTLLARPAILAEVHTDPALPSPLVSETIRFEPGITLAPRTVVEAVEICGVQRPPGTRVACSFLTANRDPTVWREPDAFVPRRFLEPDTPKLLSFGGGPHYCLGAALARMTLEETVRGVAALAPTLAADPDEIAWVQVLGRGPASLPVTT